MPRARATSPRSETGRRAGAPPICWIRITVGGRRDAQQLPEVVGHRDHRMIPPPRLALGGLAEDGVDPPVEVAPSRRRDHRQALANLPDDRTTGSDPRPGFRYGNSPVSSRNISDAQRVDVGRPIDRRPRALDLLGRHVEQRPQHLVQLGDPRRRAADRSAGPGRSRRLAAGRRPPNRTFVGLISRWTTPCRWACSSPSASVRTSPSTSATVESRYAPTRSSSDPPSRYSIVRNGGMWPTSWSSSLQRFSWLSRSTASTSIRNRSRTSRDRWLGLERDLQRDLRGRAGSPTPGRPRPCHRHRSARGRGTGSSGRARPARTAPAGSNGCRQAGQMLLTPSCAPSTST